MNTPTSNKFWLRLGWLVCVLGFPQAVLGDALRALVIGVDAYRQVNPLDGAVNDANDLATTLKKLGVQDLVVLRDEQANRTGIQKEIHGLLERTQPGDTLMITFSGHGAQQSERLKGSEQDGLDEMLLLPGFDWKGPGTKERVLDDEVNEWLLKAQQKGAEVLLFVDTCHSGTMTRAFDPRVKKTTFRGIPSFNIEDDQLDLAITPELAKKENVDFPNVSFFAGGQEHQQIPEIVQPGSAYKRGAMSYALARGLEGWADQNHDGQLSRAELQHYLRENVRQLTGGQQTPNLLPEENGGKVLLPVVRSGKPLALAESHPVRLAVLGVAVDQAKNMLDKLQNALLVADTDNPELIWDPVKQEIILAGSSGDLAAQGVGAGAVQAVVDKFRTMAFLGTAPNPDPLVMRVAPDDGRHHQGAKLVLTLRGLAKSHVVLFNLSGNGTIQYLYPLPGEDPVVQNDSFSLDLEVTPPFGADHFIAIASAEPLSNLVTGLQDLDQRPKAGDIPGLIQKQLVGVNYRLGMQGVFTGP